MMVQKMGTSQKKKKLKGNKEYFHINSVLTSEQISKGKTEKIAARNFLMCVPGYCWFCLALFSSLCFHLSCSNAETDACLTGALLCHSF